jgi:hypothetical protein
VIREHGENYGGMMLTGKTEELLENPVPVPLCLPQIPHGVTRARTRASAVRGRRLTAWAIAWPCLQMVKAVSVNYWVSHSNRIMLIGGACEQTDVRGIFGPQRGRTPVPVVARSDAYVVNAWSLRSWDRIPLKAWMFVLVCLCCVVCRQADNSFKGVLPSI